MTVIDVFPESQTSASDLFGLSDLQTRITKHRNATEMFYQECVGNAEMVKKMEERSDWLGVKRALSSS